MPPDATGVHEAHGCSSSPPDRVVTIVLEPDGALPACVIVDGQQRLRVVNRMVAVLHGRARRALVAFAGVPPEVLPVGATLVFDQPFASYLAVGEHFLYYNGDRGRLDIWLK